MNCLYYHANYVVCGIFGLALKINVGIVMFVCLNENELRERKKNNNFIGGLDL